MAEQPSFSGKETDEQAGKESLDIRPLVYEYLESQSSDKEEEIRKNRARMEFYFSLGTRLAATITVLGAVFFLYCQLFQIINGWSSLKVTNETALTALVSGIIISTTTLLSFLLVRVFRNNGEDKHVHPMQNFLSNPNVSRIFNLSVQAPLE